MISGKIARLSGAAFAALSIALSLCAPAYACRYTSDQTIFFARENDLPVIEGTVAVYLEVVGTWMRDDPVAARIEKVVKGDIGPGDITLEGNVPPCNVAPGPGSRGLVIGRVTKDAAGNVRLAALWERKLPPFEDDPAVKDLDAPKRPRLPACPLPSPGANAKIMAIGVDRGRIDSPISTMGNDRRTLASRVILEGDRPLYLVLGSRAPMVWKVEGKVDLVDRVIVVSPSRIGGMYTSAVAGVPPDKVTFDLCLPIPRGNLDDDILRRVLERQIGRYDRIVYRPGLHGIRLPSFDEFGPSDLLPDTVAKMDGAVWMGPLTKYAIPPGKPGIAALLRDGALEEMMAIPARLAEQRTKVYRIVKHIERLPAWDRYTIYVLPSGMQAPVNAMDYCVFDGSSGRLADVSRGHEGCGVTNILTSDGRDSTPQARPAPDIPVRPNAYIRIQHIGSLGPLRRSEGIRGFIEHELSFASYRIVGAPAERGPTPTLDSSNDYHLVLFGSDSPTPGDVVPIAGFAHVPYVAMTSPTFSGSLAEFVAYARSRPGPIRYVDTGNPTALAATERFLKHFSIAGERMPATRDAGFALVISGKADLMFSTILYAVEVARSGRVRSLAITGEARHALLPEIPTMAETFPGYSIGDWYAVGAPKDTSPTEMVALTSLMKTVRSDPETKAKFRSIGAEAFDADAGTISRLLGR
jgi:hypothetical protein